MSTRPGICGPSADHLSDKARGALLTFLGVVVLSPDALLIRLIDADQWTILFWRGLLSGLTLLTLFSLAHRSDWLTRIRAIGLTGLAISGLMAVSNTFFVAAITTTPTANALAIVAVGPFLAVIVSLLLLRESPSRSTWIATIVVFLGMTIIFTGAADTSQLRGSLAALVATAAQATALTLIRRVRLSNMIPAAAIGQVGSAVIALLFGAGTPARSDYVFVLILGLIVLPGAVALITTGPRLISAPEVSLIAQAEVILGPLWVWLVLDEVPTVEVLIGGVLILVTLTTHALTGGPRHSQPISLAD